MGVSLTTTLSLREVTELFRDGLVTATATIPDSSGGVDTLLCGR